MLSNGERRRSLLSVSTHQASSKAGTMIGHWRRSLFQNRCTTHCQVRDTL